ncbi:MAG: hypothetical protein AAGJ93_15600 [Bacteroidota bacterium]
MQKLSFFLFLCLLLTACNEKIHQQLAGSWQVVECEASMPSLSPAIVEGARQEALSTSYIFAEDGTIFMNADYYPDGINGLWEYDEQTAVMNISYPTAENGGLETYVIEIRQKDRMVWVQDFKQLGKIRLTLEKG